MSCNDCPEVTCLCSVPACAGLMKVGVATPSTQYWVHVLKANGSEYIHAVISDSAGGIFIDLDVPDPSFYNQFDGKYTVWVVQPVNGYYNCDCTDQVITTPSGTFTRGSFDFVKASGVTISQVTLNTTSC